MAANAIIAFGLLQGHTISTADAVKAYLPKLVAITCSYVGEVAEGGVAC